MDREKYERYKARNVEVKRRVEEAKRAVNNRWGQGFGRSFEEKKKKFWKEVKRISKGGSRIEETVKDENGRLLKGDDARGRWVRYFENLFYVEEDREADVVAVGDIEVPVMADENERDITREEVERALNETKTGKALRVRAELLKGGCDCIGIAGKIV